MAFNCFATSFNSMDKWFSECSSPGNNDCIALPQYLSRINFILALTKSRPGKISISNIPDSFSYLRFAKKYFWGTAILRKQKIIISLIQ